MTRFSHMLYLHGFRSSPASTKAQWFSDWMARVHPSVQWHCPALSASPATAMVQMQDAVQHWDPARTLVMGSSLGGFYATWLAAWFGCHAVLLNPAVHPARDLQHHLGVHPVWHDPSQTIEIKQSDIDALWPFYCGKGLQWVPAEKRMASQLQHDSPNLMAWVATGDEVLDWQEMAWRYSESRTHIIQGSDHGLSDIADHVHLLAAWLNPR